MNMAAKQLLEAIHATAGKTLCHRQFLSLNSCHKYSTNQTKKGLFRQLAAHVDVTSQEFKINLENSLENVSKLKQVLVAATSGGGSKAIERHTIRNKKLLVEERLKMLFDDYDSVLEVAPLAGMGLKYGDIPRAGVLAAIGKIHGVHCLVFANDATVKAGTIYPITLEKQLRCHQIAQRNRLPCVYVVDSGGAFLPLQADIFNTGGRTFYNEAILNSMNIQQLAIVCGSCTAGGAYVPTMAQEAIIVKRIGSLFLGGPPLVQAALGEVVTPDELGGAMLHSSVSGCTDYYAETEEDAFEMGRDSVAAFNIEPSDDPSDYAEPVHDINEMLGLIPKVNQHEMDMFKVIARIVDGSRFHEFKAKYGTSLVSGFAKIKGYMVGILGNQGEMTEQAALKGAHFVQMCSQRNIPLIFLQNTCPSMLHVDDEENAILLGKAVRGHAKLMGAVACATVPKLTVIVGNSFGNNNFMMGGRSFDPEFVFCWPNAKTALMEPSQLISMLTQSVSDDELPAAKAEETGQTVKDQVSIKASALYSSGNLWDDGVIMPQDTRKVLGQALSIVSQHRTAQEDVYSVLRM